MKIYTLLLNVETISRYKYYFSPSINYMNMVDKTTYCITIFNTTSKLPSLIKMSEHLTCE